MIDNLNDVNRVLLALETLEATRSRTPRRLLLRYLSGEAIYGQNPQFEPILDFLRLIDVISERPNGLGITLFGRELLAQNVAKTYELRTRQRTLLLRKCYLDGPFRSQTKALVKKFVLDTNTGHLSWSSIDSEPLGDIEWVGNHFVQLGALERSRHLLVTTSTYNRILVDFQDEGGDFTETQFDKLLKEKRILSKIAESFVMHWERQRLRRAGHRVEAECITRISKLRVHAGYDINSFDGASALLVHDRFIEVKGSGKTTVRFVWTPNEMQKATTLGPKYWIYFVGGIERRERIVKREPVMLHDPQATLTSARGFTVQPEGKVLVEANIAGRPLRQKAIIRG